MIVATPGRSVARRDAIYSDFPLCVFSLSVRVQYFMDATLLNDLEEQVANLHSAVRELKQALDRKNEAIQRPQTPTPLSGCFGVPLVLKYPPAPAPLDSTLLMRACVRAFLRDFRPVFTGTYA